MTAPVVVGPAAAAVNTQEPGAFVDTLADEGFTVLRTGSKPAARAQFQSLLSQYFAVDSIGDRLIRRWRPKITPAQYAAYKAAFPNFHHRHLCGPPVRLCAGRPEGHARSAAGHKRGGDDASDQAGFLADQRRLGRSIASVAATR